MDECRHIPQVYLTMTRSGLPERRRLLKAAVGSLAAHVALFAVVAAWSGGGRLIPPPARVIIVDIRELNLPVERAGAPEKVSVPRPVRTVAQPRPVQTVAQPAPVTAAPPTQAPVTQPAASPAPAAISAPSQSLSTAGSVPSAEPVRGGGGGVPTAAPASVLPAGPTQAASVLQAATPSRGGGGYLALCRGLIEKNKNYPLMARRGRVEGTVMVSCVLARDGSIRQSGVVRSSGSTLLDNAALRAVRSVGRFPPLPPEMRSNELALEVPITFRLTAD